MTSIKKARKSFVLRTGRFGVIGFVLLLTCKQVRLEENVSQAGVSAETPIETATKKAPPSPGPCFYAEPELCLKSCWKGSDVGGDSSLCQCIQHPTVSDSWVCCNITDISMIVACVPKPSRENNSTNWLNVHVRNATFKELDISHNIWKLLRSLAVTDGNIKRITNEFTKFSVPKCLNVSHNNLTEIYPRAFTNLTQLQILDISLNNLSRIPNLSVQTNLTVDIRGNNGMLCESVLESLERSALKFVEPDTACCLMNNTFEWFNSSDSVTLRQLERMKQLKHECPSIPGHGNCSCWTEQIYKVEIIDKPTITFVAKVNCAGLGLTELPEKLPPNTILLNVSNNNITSIGNNFHGNPSYFELIHFYADNNQISSMYELEGTSFIEKFEAFHLRRNNLDKIPEYLLSNALDNNPSGRALYLGGNKLTCDCNSAKVLKLWLLARHGNIPDYNQILCNNLAQKVVELTEIKLCQSPHDWTDYIYYLIGAEITLLIALVMKVSYDYWVFKTAGYLPWPASKMPKLPCDWLCES